MELSLLEPQALQTLIDNHGKHSPALIIVDLCAPEQYAIAHIPGAIHVHPSALVSGERPAPGKIAPPQRLRALLDAIGYQPDALIVAYDDEGGGWAGRLLWTLEVLGHKQGAYLDGGMVAWLAEDRPSEAHAQAPQTAWQGELTINPEPIIEGDEILARLGDDDAPLVWDARSHEEYVGIRVNAAKGGHIPGAVNLDWLDLMDRERQLRLRTDIPELLAQRGITADLEIAVHCQSHHRSALAWLVARLQGFPNVRGFHGSWAEWGNREDTPVATGNAPG